MTSINDIGDLARILREQPEWADTIRGILLGKELLELPERFAAFVQLTEQNFQLVNQNFQLVYERLDRLESDVTELKTHVARIDSNIDRIDSNIDRIDATLNRMDGRMDNGFGMSYEFKIAKNMRGIAGQFLHIRRTRVLQGNATGPDPEFMELLEKAEENGTITEEELNEVLRLDFVLMGQRKSDGANVYAAAEASITIGGEDITRAAKRAKILATVIGQPVSPTVIGSRIDGTRTEQADASGVTVMLAPET
jgi:hypothetical protein